MGKRWTEKEVATLNDLVQKGLSIDQIVKSGKFPNRTTSAIQKKIQRLSICPTNNVEPIYSPPSPTKTTKGLKDLIRLEWSIIDELSDLAKNAYEEKHKAQFYLGLASHVRTLAQVIKLSGVKTDETQDLAKLLARIGKQARRISREHYKIWRKTRRRVRS